MKKEELKKLETELNYSELEDRLEMAQVAAADTHRCINGDGSGNGSVGQN